VNVLVLDEPTNHLDIPSREALEGALEAYEGTIITISHDRYFLDRVATQILALDGAGNAEHYNGDYTEYHDWRAARLKGGGESQRADSDVPLKTAGQTSGVPVPERKKKESAENKAARRATGPRTVSDSPRVKIIKKPREPQTIEAEIAEVEKRIAELSAEMSKPEVARDITELVRVNDDYQQADARLAELIDEWERAETTAKSSRR
jgi:ATP-binding cassette subfamily F protein 3